MENQIDVLSRPSMKELIKVIFDGPVYAGYNFSGMNNPVKNYKGYASERQLGVSFYLPDHKIVICRESWEQTSDWRIDDIKDMKYKQQIDVYKFNFLKDMGIRAYFFPTIIDNVWNLLKAIKSDSELFLSGASDYWDFAVFGVPGVLDDQTFSNLAKRISWFDQPHSVLKKEYYDKLDKKYSS